MRRAAAVLLACALAACGGGGGGGSEPIAADAQATPLAVNEVADGWATGTTGGGAAGTARTLTVRTRQELVDALLPGAVRDDTPKIVRVVGTIDGNVDATGRVLGPADDRDPAYDEAQFLAQYDPAGAWGRTPPSGPLEDARARSHANQAARVVIRVGSNTTIVGVGADARLRGVTLLVQGVDNVILRNLRFERAYDHYPAWNPLDGAAGEWNSQFDNVTIRGATRVWIHRCTFTNGPWSAPEVRFGRKVEHFDGLVDITEGADRITLSYNRFEDHDKSILVGASDTATGDAGRLRVTLHHNVFSRSRQRNPNVRFGRVHVYNNWFVGDRADAEWPHFYHLGIGIASRIVSEANAFDLPGGSASDLVIVYSGTVFSDAGSLLNGLPVDLVAAARSQAGAAWAGTDVGWVPSQAYAYAMLPARSVPAHLAANAGAGREP
jgi:pectate lyase